jgi:membrane-associated phospholipid phosphatase
MPSPDSEMPRPGVYFVAAVVLGGFFALWTWLVLGQQDIQSFDLTCATFWTEMATAHRWGFMVYLTDLGGVATMILLTIVGAIWQESLKNRVVALGWIAAMVGCGILNSGTKNVFDRPRPPEEMRDRSVHETNRSYPSGHAMGSAIGYGMLAYCLCLWQTCRIRRVLILAVIVAVVLAIGFSRMYLRAHWFSDVIGGWGLGLTWLSLCLGCVESIRLKPLSR